MMTEDTADMTEQLPATTNPKTLTSSPALDSKLSDLLLSGDSVVVGPKSAAALRAFVDEPEPELPTESDVDALVMKLAIATAQPKISPVEARERMKLYWQALRDLPLIELKGGFLRLLRTSKFLPTPCEVRTAAIQAGATRRYAKSRARHLLWLHARDYVEPKEPVPPEELRELLAKVRVGVAQEQAGKA